METGDLTRTNNPDGTATFRRRTERRVFGLPRYEPHAGPVFALEYARRCALTPGEVDPEGELTAEELDRRLAEGPALPLVDSRTTWWSSREAAEAAARRILDGADPRLGEGRGDPLAESQTRRDATSVWWALGDGDDALWRVTAVVREHREVVEREGGVVAFLDRCGPNDHGRVAVLTVRGIDGSYFHSTYVRADAAVRGSGDGVRLPEHRAAEPPAVRRVVARAAELGDDVAAAVSAALARGSVCPAAEV